jgi:hypothetical protein
VADAAKLRRAITQRWLLRVREQWLQRKSEAIAERPCSRNLSGNVHTKPTGADPKGKAVVTRDYVDAEIDLVRFGAQAGRSRRVAGQRLFFARSYNEKRGLAVVAR